MTEQAACPSYPYGQRIRKLRESADFSVYTPGSMSGKPVSILNSFSCPGAAILLSLGPGTPAPCWSTGLPMHQASMDILSVV
jgi:hypothetical protein